MESIFKVIKDIPLGLQCGAKAGEILHLDMWEGYPALFNDSNIAVCDLDSPYGLNCRKVMAHDYFSTIKGEYGLIVKSPWSKLILEGKKTMELRGSNTKRRGTVHIIESGTGKVFGSVDIIDSIKLTDEDYEKYRLNHCVKSSRQEIPYKNLYGWVLENNILYEQPLEYKHKQGCIIWVKL